MNERKRTYYSCLLYSLSLRFCTTGLPSDVVVEVDDMSFHLHKVSYRQSFPQLFSAVKVVLILKTSVILIVTVPPDVQKQEASRSDNTARGKP